MEVVALAAQEEGEDQAAASDVEVGHAVLTVEEAQDLARRVLVLPLCRQRGCWGRGRWLVVLDRMDQRSGAARQYHQHEDYPLGPRVPGEGARFPRHI